MPKENILHKDNLPQEPIKPQIASIDLLIIAVDGNAEIVFYENENNNAAILLYLFRHRSLWMPGPEQK